MSSDRPRLRDRTSRRMPKIAATAARHRAYLMVIAAALAVALVSGLLPRGLSSAADAGPAGATSTATSMSTASAPSDNGVTWAPGQVAQYEETGGGCTAWIAIQGVISAGDPGTLSAVSGALDNLAGLNIGQDGITDEDIQTVTPINSTSKNVDPQADVACSLITDPSSTDSVLIPARTPGITAALTALTGPAARPDAARFVARHGVRYAEVPAAEALALASHDGIRLTSASGWLSAAIAAIAGAAAYVAVSAVVAATMVALGAATAASGGLTAPVLAAVAGCIGGAVGTAVTLAIAGNSDSPLGTVASTALGCLTGGVLGGLSAGQLGSWLAAEIGSVLGTSQAVTGSALTLAASGAAVSLVPVAGAVAAAEEGLGDESAPAPGASTSPPPAGTACPPAIALCETVISATDGNTYYADNLGGGQGYVITVGPGGQPNATALEVSASPTEVLLSDVRPGGRAQPLWTGGSVPAIGIFGQGTSTDAPVNVVNIEGNGYIEFAATGPEKPAQFQAQVIGGDGEVYRSIRFNRADPKLQSTLKDYMQASAALNTASSRLGALIAGAAGVTTAAAGTLIAGWTSAAFTESNIITSLAAIGAVAVTGLVSLYNAWRDCDSARNNLINAFNNLNVAGGQPVAPIRMVSFGGITANDVGHHDFRSFRRP